MKPAKQKKKKHQRRRLQLLWSWARGFLVIVLLVSAGLWYILSDPKKLFCCIKEACIDSLKICSFSLKHLKIQGRKITPSLDVLRVIGICKNDSLFKKSLTDIQSSLLSLPWVKSVSVQRFLPWSLYITIEERQPMAIFQDKKTLFYIDQDGKKIDMEPYRSLLGVDFPVFLGEDAYIHAETLLKEMGDYPWISQHIRYYHFVRQRRWEFILKNGVKILLCEDNHNEALKILQKILKKATSRIQNIEKIDMRDLQKIIIKIKPGLTIGKPNVQM